jgi:ubiquinone/menaquinone biosynthesis C-methylase UbiE
MSSATAAGKAFDRIARDYDQMFTYSVIGRAQRNVVWRALSSIVRRGDRVLDMNCGTGEDALHLSTLGAQVVAFDTSAEMINVARSKVSNDSSNIEFFHGNIERVDSVVEDRFDLILSNFSGMNCVANLADVAQKLDRLTLSSGTLLLCVSTRVCLWETLFYLARGDVRRALRRWSGFWVPTVGANAVPVWYPTVREIADSMRPFFSLKSVQAVGLTVPPSYIEPWARKHPLLVSCMERFDRTVSRLPLLRVLGDHVLLEFRRSDA